MIIRITNKCRMGCRHCFLGGVGPSGDHMDVETFRLALECVQSVGGFAVLLSGGEPTESPHLFEMVDLARAASILPVIATNGMFVEDASLCQKVLGLGVHIQITHDPRYYPRRLHFPESVLKHPGVYLEREVQRIFPCRRVRESGIDPTKQYPNCFNLRSASRALGLTRAIHGLHSGRLTGDVRICTPSIDPDGTMHAGEVDTCLPIGTVRSTIKEIERSIVNLQCDRCGLAKNLNPLQRAALGA